MISIIQVIGLMSAVLKKTGYNEDLYRTKPECVRKVFKKKQLNNCLFIQVKFCFLY